MPVITQITDIGQACAAGPVTGLHFLPVAPAGDSLVRPPAFILGPAPPPVLEQLYGQTRTPQAGVYALTQAQVAPTGIAIQHQTAFHAEAFLHPPHHVTAVADRLNAADLPVRHIPGPLAIIYGPAHQTWGHWLVDFLPRLWVLRQAGYDLTALRFLLPPDIAPFAAALLRRCGLHRDQLVTYAYWSELISTDLLLMPTGLRLGDRLCLGFAAATAWWTDAARASARIRPAPPHRRLFVSRARAPQSRRLAERGAHERMAAAAGLQVIRPENLSFTRQLRLFSEARLIMGEYGSGLHNAVFAPPGTLVCALRGVWRHPGLLQTGIATALGQDSAYVFGPGDGDDQDHDYQISPADLSLALRLAGIRG